jgi:3-hydroxyacyl-CoA dehydrogenase
MSKDWWINKIGLIGASTMGNGIAQVRAAAGLSVKMQDAPGTGSCAPTGRQCRGPRAARL